MGRRVAYSSFSGWDAVCHSGRRVYPKLLNPRFEATVAMGDMESGTGCLTGVRDRTFGAPSSHTPYLLPGPSKQMGT